MKTVKIKLIAIALIGLCTYVEASETPRSRAPVDAIETWKDLRFGMFIHWGPVALTGHEIGWSRGNQTPIEAYDQLYKRFNPEQFNADEWVRVAKSAGMKYIVLTTKHHDGFCLWDTEQMDYNIMHTPFGRDVVKELSDACRKEGLGFGTYYSTCDWWHPAYPKGSPAGKTDKPTGDMDQYIEYLKAQTTELIENYGPLTAMWFDVPREVKEHHNEPTVAALRKLQPDILINNRAYEAEGNIGDFDTPEQRVGAFDAERPWETCMTIGRQWAWKPNEEVKSLKTCLRGLLTTIGGDGNFLFNVGPDAKGVIEPEQVKRLEEMGNWIAKYNKGIYATRGGPFKPAGWGASTHRDHYIYLFIYRFSPNGITLPDIGCNILHAENLSGKAAELERCDKGTILRVPEKSRDPMATVIKLTLDKPAAAIAPLEIPSFSGSLAYQKPSWSSSSFWVNPMEFAFDDNPETAWSPTGNQEEWLAVDLLDPLTIHSVRVDLEADDITLSLQAEQDYQWNTIFTMDKVSEPIEKKFPAVTAQKFRILVQGTRPSIREFQLFGAKEE